MITWLAFLGLLPVAFLGDWIRESVLAVRDMNPLARWPVAFLIGAGGATQLFFLVSLIHYPSALFVTIGCISLFAVLYLIRQREVILQWVKQRHRPGRAYLFPMIVFLPLVLLFSMAALQTGLGHDGTMLWAFRAKMLFIEGGWPPPTSFPAGWFTHMQYPLLFPLLESWIFTVVGQVDHTVIKPLVVAIFVQLILFCFFVFQQRFSVTVATLFTLFVVTTPYIYSVSALSGYADVLLMFYLFAGFAFVHRWLQSEGVNHLLIGQVLLATSALVKREGLVYVAVVLGVVFLFQARRRLIRQQWVVAVLPALVLVVPWSLFNHYYQVPNQDFVISGDVLVSQISWLPTIADYVLREWFHGVVDNWGLLWILFFGILFWRWPRWFRFPTSFTIVFTFTPLILMSMFVFSQWEGGIPEHMDFTVARLWLHIVPIAWFFVFTEMPDLEDWFRRNRKAIGG